MSYTPTEWKTGDVITAPKLNNIEQGIVSAGVMIATLTEDSGSYTCDKTYNEIKEVVDNGGVVVVKASDSEGTIYIPLTKVIMTNHGIAYLFENTECDIDTGTKDTAYCVEHSVMITSTEVSYEKYYYNFSVQEE